LGWIRSAADGFKAGLDWLSCAKIGWSDDYSPFCHRGLMTSNLYYFNRSPTPVLFVTMNRLSAQEISFFKRQGYLIKKGVLDPELMRRARQRKWVGAPDRMKPDDPTTWIGPWRPEEETSEAEKIARSATPGNTAKRPTRSG